MHLLNLGGVIITANKDVRLAIEKNRLRYFEVAHVIGVSEATFTRWLRFELPEEKKKLILSAVDRLLSLRG